MSASLGQVAIGIDGIRHLAMAVIGFLEILKEASQFRHDLGCLRKRFGSIEGGGSLQAPVQGMQPTHQVSLVPHRSTASTVEESRR